MKILKLLLFYLTFTLSLEAKNIFVLSIDGGGVRGIIPAKILAHLEKELKGKHLTECFDVMGGTSAGGIIVLLLNVPNQDGKPKYTAEHVIELYKKFSQQVFYRSLLQKVKTLNGWMSTKYENEVIRNIFDIYFQDHYLDKSLTNILVPAYDIYEEKTHFFRSHLASRYNEKNYMMKDVALATSAAPTYFSPVKITNKPGTKDHILIDGGVAVNNPSLSALVHALELYGPGNDYIVLSIGTGTTFGANRGKLEFRELEPESMGKLDWASNIVTVLMESVNDVTHYQLMHIMPIISKQSRYYRLQIILDPKYSELDNSDAKNIEILEKYADKLIIRHKSILKNVSNMLNSKRLLVD